MKKLVLILFVLFSIGVNAQTESHLEFKGIPITGSIDSMIDKLKVQGYELIEIEEDAAILEGKFANESCKLYVWRTPKTKIVYQILVKFDSKDSWWTLKSDYKKLKEQIRTKYNIKPDVTEGFLDPYYEGDGYELQAIRLGQSLHSSNFQLSEGKIMLLIMNSPCVRLYYVDAIGDALNEQEENQNSYDDL
ncbi:MAG: hypothetical protein IJZ87_02045 [Bacteroidales bacterium]|nr:hypothetical protein [Bacteroidales bacterium]